MTKADVSKFEGKIVRIRFKVFRNGGSYSKEGTGTILKMKDKIMYFEISHSDIIISIEYSKIDRIHTARKKKL